MTAEAVTVPRAQEAAVPVILCVDDEANIVNALKRLFRPLGYRVVTAPGGQAGLDIITSETVDVVISDMRMPEMDGAQFLERVKAISPDTVRILLTGHADVESAVAAINKGGVRRYVSKPWNDQDLLMAVHDAIEHKQLQQHNRHLQALTLKQNSELKQLNEGLEALVEQRAGELRRALSELEEANRKLKEEFLTSVKVFASLIEMHDGLAAGRSRRVAELARRMAGKLAMGPVETQDVTVAALLHDIGKIGLSDEILHKPMNQLRADELVRLKKHPIRGETALMALERLQGVAKLIRAHQERFDGRGYPDGLSGLDIPLGARVLAVAIDFESAQQGALTGKPMSAFEARHFILNASGKRYDPQVIAAFAEPLGSPQTAPSQDIALTVVELRPGMVLSRDLITGDGLMLVAARRTIDDPLIQQIKRFEASTGGSLTVHVRAPA
jgi:response regulator RpfG family c-di-GMP phosphodiesterase